MTLFTLEEASGVVHMVKEVKCERAVRKAIVKCGATVIDDANTRPTEWTIANSYVTCPACGGSDV